MGKYRLFARGEFRIGLQAALSDIHAFIFLFFGYTNPDGNFEEEPDQQTGGKYPCEYRYNTQ
jgi:hypothetical protein